MSDFTSEWANRRGVTPSMELTSGAGIYNIANNGEYFFAGFLGNGNQVLMGVQLSEIIVVEFDTEGKCLGLSIHDAAQDSILPVMQRLQNELQFTPGIISVNSFIFQDRWVGIQELPEHYQDVLDRPEGYEDERRAILREDIRQWRERGDFVLLWDEEYYLNRWGEVDSS